MDPIVLVVEDDDDSRSSLRDVLEVALPGTSVHAVADAGEALRAMDGEHVAVLISDFKLPGEDGLSLLAQARTRAPGTVRILVTAQPVVDLPRDALALAHPHHIVPKPLEAEALVGLVAGVMDNLPPALP